MRSCAFLLFTAALACAAPRPFLEIAGGLPELADIRAGAEMGGYGAALGTGLPLLAAARPVGWKAS